MSILDYTLHLFVIKKNQVNCKSATYQTYKLTLSLTLNVSITVRTARLASFSFSPLIELEMSNATTTSRGTEVVVET